VRERRVIPVYSLLLVCVLSIQSAHEAAGAKGIRRSPRPLWAEDKSTARAHGAARSRTCVQPSLRANGSRECAPDDRLREAIHLAAQRKNGLLRFARNDGSAPRKKVAQKRCHTTNIEPQTFIQGGSVPYPPVPTRNDGSALRNDSEAIPARRRWADRRAGGAGT